MNAPFVRRDPQGKSTNLSHPLLKLLSDQDRSSILQTCQEQAPLPQSDALFQSHRMDQDRVAMPVTFGGPQLEPTDRIFNISPFPALDDHVDFPWGTSEWTELIDLIV